MAPPIAPPGTTPVARFKNIIVENPADEVVDHELTAQVIAVWRAHGAHIETRELPANLALIHDYIDPTQPEQQVDVVYPLLTELLIYRYPEKNS